MKKYLTNSFVDLSLKNDMHIIDVFSDVSWNKKIIVHDNSHLTYLIVVKNASLDFQIEVVGQHSFCQIFVVCISDGNLVDMKIHTKVSNSSVKVEKYVLSLLWEHGKISVDANIDIVKWVKNVVGHLLEENIVFGQNISLKSLPALSVSSYDVQASHAAKIEKINQDKSFYMQSKWLSQTESQRLIVDGYVHSVLSCFSPFDEKELSSVRSFIQF